MTSETDFYRIPIDIMSEKFKKDILPLMVLGLKGMKCLDNGLRLARLFWPTRVPKIPNECCIEKAESFVESKTKGRVDVIQKEMDNRSTKEEKRGPELREFAAILKEWDTGSTFHGLYRLYDEKGTAIWVTKESRNKIEEKKDASAKSGTGKDQNEIDVCVVAAAGIRSDNSVESTTNGYDMNAI